MLFQTAVIPSANDYKLLEYSFSDFGFDDDDTLKASVRMFLELDLLERFRINYDVSTSRCLRGCLSYRCGRDIVNLNIAGECINQAEDYDVMVYCSICS